MALARPQDRQLLESLYRTGISAVNAYQNTLLQLATDEKYFQIGGFPFERSKLKRIVISGAGKASATMASAVEEFLFEEFPEIYAGGLIAVNKGNSIPLYRTRFLEGAHPLPDESSFRNGEEILSHVKQSKLGDLIIFLLSGGASALMASPSEGILPGEKIALSEVLLKCGANIHEINTLRKHCSQIKGGRLFLSAPHCSWVTLAISDVPDDVPESIGSAPTLADPTTLEDCRKIVEKYHLTDFLPESILNHLKKPNSRIPQNPDEVRWHGETPKPEDKRFTNSHFKIIAKNRDAVKAAQVKAREAGYSVAEESHFFKEEISQVAQQWKGLKQNYDRLLPKPYVIIFGGEPVVAVKGSGQGGRNMELAMRVAMTLSGKFTFLSAGTDGRDGSTSSAGAFADETTVSRANVKGFNVPKFLDKNDSYPFFEKLGDLFTPGPTGTNVMDLQMMVVWK